MAADFSPSAFRKRIASYLSLSLAIGWSAAAALQMIPSQVTATAVTIAPVEASFAPRLNPAKPAAKVIQSKVKAPRSIASTKVESPEPSRAIVSNKSGHLVVDANEIILTDGHRPRVATLLFEPVKKALIAYQATKQSPEVTIVASSNTPVAYVTAVQKFMAKFYGWRVNVEQGADGEVFQVQVNAADRGGAN